MSAPGLDDMGALELVELGPGTVETEGGFPRHQAPLRVDVCPLFVIIESVPT